jgi:hypothetical protein
MNADALLEVYTAGVIDRLGKERQHPSTGGHMLQLGRGTAP